MTGRPLKDVVRERIRALRTERRLTQEELCARADVSVDAVNRIENGTRVPTIDTLEKLSSALGVSTADLLLTLPVKPSKLTPAVRRVVALLDGEPQAVQEGVEELVRGVIKLTKTKRPAKR